MSDDPPRPAGQPSHSARRRWLTGGVAAAAVSAGLGVAWWRQPRHPPSGPGAAANADADLSALWALTLARPEGGELALATLRGKPLLLNFWATWCPPCVRELPEIDRFHREFGPRGWQVLGVAIDSPTPVRVFLEKVKIGYPIGLAGLEGTDLVFALGNPQGGLPFSVMIDARGRVLQRKMGETHFDELAGWAARA